MVCVKHNSNLYMGKFNIAITGLGSVFSAGSIITGDFKNLECIENGEISFENGSKYKGSISYLAMHGDGTLFEKES